MLTEEHYKAMLEDVDLLVAETAATIVASASARRGITIESDARERAVQQVRDLVAVAGEFALPYTAAHVAAADAFHRGITADQFRTELEQTARDAHEAIWAKRNGRSS